MLQSMTVYGPWLVAWITSLDEKGTHKEEDAKEHGDGALDQEQPLPITFHATRPLQGAA